MIQRKDLLSYVARALKIFQEFASLGRRTFAGILVGVLCEVSKRTFAWWRHMTTTTRMYFAAIFVMQMLSRTSDSSQKEKNTEYNSLPQSILVLVVEWRHHAHVLFSNWFSFHLISTWVTKTYPETLRLEAYKLNWNLARSWAQTYFPPYNQIVS